MASVSLAKAKEQLDKVRQHGRNIRARAKEKTGALMQRGAAGATGYAYGYYERERKELPGAKIERVGTMNMNAIAGMPAPLVYGAAGTLLQLVMPQGGVMAKVADAADGALDASIGCGAMLFAMSRERTPAQQAAASGVDMGGEEIGY